MPTAKYQARDDATDIVDAEQLAVDTELQTPLGIEKASVGDWLLTDADGVQRALSNDLFQSLYGPVEEKESKGRAHPAAPTEKKEG
jgi:hypothetical protein